MHVLITDKPHKVPCTRTLFILNRFKTYDTTASLVRKYKTNESSVREIRKNKGIIRCSVTKSGTVCSINVYIGTQRRGKGRVFVSPSRKNKSNG
jgi:hypothetical protein